MSIPIPDKSSTSFRFKEEWTIAINKLFQKVEYKATDSRCLSVCNETGVVAIVRASQVLVTWLKCIQESTNELRQYKLLEVSKAVQNLGFADSGNILYVQLEQETKLQLFSVVALFDNKTEPFQTISLSSVFRKIWSVGEHFYCGNHTQIERVHWPTMKQQVLLCFPEPIQDWVFSPDGKIVATITKGAKLQLWDETGKEMHQQNLSLELPLPKVELFWNHMATLFVMVHRMDGMLLIHCTVDSNTRIQQVTIYSSPFIETPSSVNNGISPFGMMQVVQDWEIFILAVSYSTDIHAIYKEEEKLYILLLEEGEEISCPLDEQSQDTFPISLALDWTNTLPVVSKESSETKLCAMPRLVLLLNNYMLKYYSVIDEHCTQPCKKIGQPKAPTAIETNGLGFKSTPLSSSILTPQRETTMSGSLLGDKFNTSSKYDASSKVDMNTVLDDLTNKMQQLFLEISSKQDSLDSSLSPETVDRRMLRIDALYQDSKVQCRKLLQQYDRLHKEWVEQVIRELEECEKIRLEAEKILNNTDQKSEMFLKEWIHPQWKEMEQLIQQKKRDIQQAFDCVEEFLDKVYRDRKTSISPRDTIRISQRQKIFQTLFMQRQRLESLYKRFQVLEKASIEPPYKSSVLSTKYLKDSSSLFSWTMNGEDKDIVMDRDSLKKVSEWINQMALNDGRNEIRPQQKPLDFSKVKRTDIREQKENTGVAVKQDKLPVATSSMNNSNKLSEGKNTPSFFGTNSSSSFSASWKATTVERESKESPTRFVSSAGTFPREHTLPDTTHKPNDENAHKEPFKKNTSFSFQYTTNANTRVDKEKVMVQGSSPVVETRSTGGFTLHKSTKQVQDTPSQHHEMASSTTPNEKPKDTKNEDNVSTTNVARNTSNDAMSQHKANQSEVKTAQVIDSDISKLTSTDQSVMRDFEAMDFSNDRESNTKNENERSSLQVQPNPFGGSSPLTSGSTVSTWSGFGSSTSGASSLSSGPNPFPTTFQTPQQNVTSKLGFNAGFASVANNPNNNPFVTNANTSPVAGYQFGSPSPFVSPVAGAFGVSNVTPPTNRTSFGTTTSFGSTGPNPFASLAQRSATSPVLGSSNSFANAPSSGPLANVFSTWSQSASAAASLPPSFSQMRK